MEARVNSQRRVGGIRQIACAAIATVFRFLARPPLSLSKSFERAADWFEEQAK